jgi:HSP20 family protein
MYRRYLYRSPRNDFNQLQRELNELLSTKSRQVHHPAPCYPAVNVLSNESEAIFTAEIPGMNLSDIEISLEGDNLKITGEITTDKKDDAVIYHRQERGCGKFERAIQLPFPVQSEKVNAVYDKGVLKVTLPRAEADKPRKIEIKTQ